MVVLAPYRMADVMMAVTVCWLIEGVIGANDDDQ